MDDPLNMIDAPSGAPGGLAAAAMPEAPYLEGLNPAQREAVEILDGPLLVLSGAGTGKTRVLTTRFAHILAQGRARPWEVLGVTFTNKAAHQMRERIARLLGHPADELWLGTFHALCVRILRPHVELIGLESNFTILDTDDQLRLLKQILQAADIDTKRWPARGLAAVIGRWKDRGLTPDKVTPAEDSDYADGRALEFYRQYQARLRTVNAADFGDLLLHCLTLFTDHPEIAERYQQRFRYILVDEYQDTNVAQYLWLRLLAQGHRNICCVGDDDQSIYGWRGAEIDNILRFDKDFPGARIVRLEQNYRSTGHILGAASHLIAHNAGRLGKTLWTDGADGDKLTLQGVWDGEEEARLVAGHVETLHRAGTPFAEMAVLVRAGFQTREFEERLMTLGIPYKVIGGPRFYERLEIRDALAYLRVVVQPNDDLAFERIVNTPKRGIGAATLQALHLHARAEGVSLTRAARQLLETDELRPAVRGTLGGLLDDFERWRARMTEMPHPELVETVLDESGYAKRWQEDKSPDAPGRLENLKELVVAVAEFETLGGFLEHVTLVTEQLDAEGGDMVGLMTLHGAKGLEFDIVFLPGWEEELFPHARALEEGGGAALEEERRLAYVGLTRARKRVFLSFAANRRVHNQWRNALPSRFIDELPPERVDVVTGQGLYGGRRAGGGLAEGGDPWGPPRRARRAWRGGAAEGAALADATDRVAPSGGHAVGDRVFHQKFGYGRVAAVDGNKLEVAFDKAGTKKVVDSFVQPA